MSNIIFDNFLSDNWLDALGRESNIQSLSKLMTFIYNEINLNKKIYPEIKLFIYALAARVSRWEL